MDVDVILLNRKKLNGQSVSSDEQILHRSKVLPRWEFVRIREAHVKPRRLIRIMVLDSRNHSEAVSVVKCSRYFRRKGEMVCGDLLPPNWQHLRKNVSDFEGQGTFLSASKPPQGQRFEF